MCKSLLTIIVILISSNVAVAASAKGRVRMVVVRSSTNVPAADVNVVKNKTSLATVEYIY